MLLLITCCQRIFQDDGDGKRPLGRFIAHGGSSSPKLCTSHTGAGDVLCSGLKHPGHPAFPGVSATKKGNKIWSKVLSLGLSLCCVF